MDDCFNVSFYTAGRKARKEFQKPYTKPTDFRLNVSTVKPVDVDPKKVFVI